MRVDPDMESLDFGIPNSITESERRPRSGTLVVSGWSREMLRTPTVSSVPEGEISRAGEIDILPLKASNKNHEPMYQFQVSESHAKEYYVPTSPPSPHRPSIVCVDHLPIPSSLHNTHFTTKENPGVHIV